MLIIGTQILMAQIDSKAQQKEGEGRNDAFGVYDGRMRVVHVSRYRRREKERDKRVYLYFMNPFLKDPIALLPLESSSLDRV